MTAIQSRPYQDLDDLRDMQRLLMESSRMTGDWRYPHVGDLLWLFMCVSCHLGAPQHVRLWHDGPKLVAYAILAEDPLFEWEVHPHYKWSGIENEAWLWAAALIDDLSTRNPAHFGGRCRSGAREDDQMRIAFLEENGFCPGGQFSEVDLARSLDDPIPELPLPEGCQVRNIAGQAEIAERAAALRDVWLPWSEGNISYEDYAWFRELPGFPQDLDMIAFASDGQIGAFTIGYLDPLNRVGVLGDVGCRPAYRRQGLTRLVLLECLRRMRSHGMQRCLVSTTIDNDPAIRLYESIGFTPSNRYNEYILEST
jgi:ribosomal protein S18 acetylase RimI-like enzyme